MAAASADAIDGMHRDIEAATRKLEFEKRRLQRLERELTHARQIYAAKMGHKSPGSARLPEADDSFTANGPLTAPRRPRSSPVPAVEGNGSQGAPLPQGEWPIPCRTLANRLDLQLKRLDSIRSDNAGLRTEIDAIRRQRLQLNGIFDRLALEIEQRSAQLTNSIVDMEANRDIHFSARTRVAAARRQQELERSDFNGKILRLRKDLLTADHQRKDAEVKLRRASEGVQKKKELIIPEEESSFAEIAMMRRIMKAAFLNCIQRRHIKQHQKNIEIFEQAFATIKDSTGISDIKEIVRIFVNLESQNFSLLTYVNHMNQEIETLEGMQRGREEEELARQTREEQEERRRDEALADLQKQLQVAELALVGDREACNECHELVLQVKPCVLRISQLFLREFQGAQKAHGPWHVEDPLTRLPPEFKEETLPEWLDWMENALGRFRDAVPASDQANREPPFPSTAAAAVKLLPPKKLHGHGGGQQPLVRLQELPTLVGPVDDAALAAQKRSHGNSLTPNPKAEPLDEDSEDEDYDKVPLMFDELRSRVKQALSKRRRRGAAGRGAGDARSEELHGSSATTTSPSRGPSHMTGSPWPVSPVSEASPSRRRSSGLAGEASFAPDAAEGERGAKDAVQAAGRRGSETQPLEEVSEGDLEGLFLSRYEMTRGDLEVMAANGGIALHSLCFLKREFDFYDEDKSGRINAQELRNLLHTLGEEPSPAELATAIEDLDANGSGDIEFFEFFAWFTRRPSG